MSFDPTLPTGPTEPADALRAGRRAPRTRQSGAATSLAAQGEPLVWLSGGALALAVTMICGLIVLVIGEGMLTFWPTPLVQVKLADGTVYLGELTERQTYQPTEQVLAGLTTEVAERAAAEAKQRGGVLEQEKLRVENFELSNTHFVWVDDFQVVDTSYPEWAVVVERRTDGRFYGLPAAFLVDGQEVATTPAAAWAKFEEYHGPVAARWRQRVQLEKHDLGYVSRRKNAARLNLKQQELSSAKDSPAYLQAQQELAEVERWEGTENVRISAEIGKLNAENARYQIRFSTADGQSATMALENIVRAFPANQLGLFGRMGVYISRWGEFLWDDPGQTSGEGGVFPAIFGTVAMTLIMTLAVVPFGVLAALYLREYAKAGAIVSIVRIAINNLAGVPSIVFGVFGLGFFCYVVGARIDELFFAATLADTGRSTYGTGGIFWASLTLALLTLPVVIVTTEEALASVPSSMREGSYACGASKWQTIHRIVLPRAMPGIMTGMILAMARGAGEVAPIMLVGAVKLAPELPVDGVFPYLHPERSFMHLGYQIYDLGFHSQNSVAAVSMLFTTTLLLVTIVAALNITAIWLRSRLRRRFVSSHF